MCFGPQTRSQMLSPRGFFYKARAGPKPCVLRTNKELKYEEGQQSFFYGNHSLCMPSNAAHRGILQEDFKQNLPPDNLRCLVCRCGARMRIVSFITDPRVVDRILRHRESGRCKAQDPFEPRVPPRPRTLQ